MRQWGRQVAAAGMAVAPTLLGIGIVCASVLDIFKELPAFLNFFSP